jgi:hypothetical protein
VPLPGSFRALVVDRAGRGWCTGEVDPVFTLTGEAMTPPAVAVDFHGADAVVVGERRGMLHLFIDGVWEEYAGWPISFGTALATPPVVARRADGAAVAVADAAERLHCVDGEGNEMPGFPIDLITGGEYVGNIVVTADTFGTADGLFVLNVSTEGDQPVGWVTRWNMSGSGVEPAGGYPYGIGLSPEDLEGDVVLLGGDINPNEPEYEVYIVFMSSGKILLCGSSGVLSRRTGESAVSSIPAVSDLDGDGYLELVYSDGRTVYAVAPSGANLTGWPQTLRDIYYVRWELGVTAPMTTIRTPGGVKVVAGTDAGLLYLFDHHGELVYGYPKKVSGSLHQAVDVIAVADEALLGIFDDGRASTVYPAELRRPGRGAMKWRRSPYGAALEDFSWRTAWGDFERTAFARRSAPVPVEERRWLDLPGSLIVYPNPSDGDRVGFHFTAPSDGRAHLEIMTLAGELVAERTKELAGGEDEFVVSMSGNASGVYICRIVVSSGGRSVQAFRKFAIVH